MFCLITIIIVNIPYMLWKSITHVSHKFRKIKFLAKQTRYMVFCFDCILTSKFACGWVLLVQPISIQRDIYDNYDTNHYNEAD